MDTVRAKISYWGTVQVSVTTLNGGYVLVTDLPQGINVEVRMGKGADTFYAQSDYPGLSEDDTCGLIYMEVWGQRGNDSIYKANYADGGKGDDLLKACDQGSTLRGRDNRDDLYGGDGADDMRGNSGNDDIYQCGAGDSCDD